MRRRTTYVLLGVLIFALLAYFLFRNRRSSPVNAEAAAPAPAAAVSPVTRGSLSSDLKVSGQFTPYQEVDLHAKVSGYIRRINVDIGDRVHAGQVIATLEVPELDAQLSGAKAEVRHSNSEIERAKSEVARAQSNHTAVHAAYTRLDQAAKQRPGLIAQQELDDARAKDQDAEAQINVAKAALEATQQQLGVSQADSQRVQALSDYSVVISPFNGIVTRRYADDGALIQAGTSSSSQAIALVRIAQSDLLRLRMPVPESDVRFIKEGGVVQVSVGAINRTFDAKIVRFTRALDASTRTMLAEVDVSNPNLTLSPGMYAETQIVLQRRTNVLTVPTQALIENGDQPTVLIVDSANKVEKKTVSVGIHSADRTEITSGLSGGESVIVSGQTNYQTGELVRPQANDIKLPTDGGNQ